MRNVKFRFQTLVKNTEHVHLHSSNLISQFYWHAEFIFHLANTLLFNIFRRFFISVFIRGKRVVLYLHWWSRKRQNISKCQKLKYVFEVRSFYPIQTSCILWKIVQKRKKLWHTKTSCRSLSLPTIVDILEYLLDDYPPAILCDPLLLRENIVTGL